ncbi:MAG: BofC C-terminal domain-containing protein [Defluviitaleaceae bacterium]|nr:BofC C-terminal domain-containing protein [Defluviitaleaceae bacterium]
MGRVAKYAATAFAVAVLFGVLGYAGYRYLIPETGLNTHSLGLIAVQAGTESDDLQADAEPEYIPVIAAPIGTLGVDAKIIYRYHYLIDGHVEVNAEDAPYFLVGLTREELAERLSGWELVEFSSQLAVFERRINARRTERYTVGVLDGYVAVFYDEEVNGSRVKELTEIPVDAFSEDELLRLVTGIRVAGEEQLLKVLEDYSS